MKNRIIIIASVVLTIGGLVWLFVYIYGVGGHKYKWYEDYRMTNKEPYGCYIISEMLKTYYKGEKFEVMKKSFSETMKADSSVKKKNYLFVGENIYLDSAGHADMLKFVAGGNDVFIASKYIPNELMYDLYDYRCGSYWQGYDYYEDSVAEMNFYHPQLKEKKEYTYIYRKKEKNYRYYWTTVNSDVFCDTISRFIPLAYLKTNDGINKVTFFKINYGKGHFYLHTIPLTFTNYFLLDDNKLEYAEKIFSHLGRGTIYWDEYSRIPHYDYKQNDPWNYDKTKQADSPLQYILNNEGLKWSWYIMLALVVVYLIFRTKRRQRVIPLLEPNTNTSLEFVQTIGRLYFVNNDHRKLCIQKMKQYLAFIRGRYFVPTNSLDDMLMQKISVKSEVRKEKVEMIFKQYQWLSSTGLEITEFELIKFHESIDYFYKNCK